VRRVAVSVREQIKVLNRALGMLDNIGHLTPQASYEDPDLMPEDQKHLLDGLMHLASAEEHLDTTLQGVRVALQAFHRADEIVPLDGQALVEARRAHRIFRVLGEVGQLLGGVRASLGVEDADPDLLTPAPVRRPEPTPTPEAGDDS
jgi:hypothetical protein